MVPVFEQLSGFDWDSGNRTKCTQHGVSVEEIEALFESAVTIIHDTQHSEKEIRYRAIGKTAEGRYVFVVFVIRETRIRPISARFMHAKEIRRHEKDNPDV